MNRFFIVFVVCVVATGVVGAQSCHLNQLEACLDPLSGLSAPQNPTEIIASAVGFGRVCRVVKEDVFGCLWSFMSRCGTPAHKEISRLLVDHWLKHVSDVCETSFTTDLLAVSPCLHEKLLSQKHFQKTCNNPFHAITAHALVANISLHARIDDTCCGYRQWEACARPLIHDSCGPKGVKAFEGLVAKGFANWPEMVCERKQYSPKATLCSEKTLAKTSSSSATTHSILSLFSFLIPKTD